MAEPIEDLEFWQQYKRKVQDALLENVDVTSFSVAGQNYTFESRKQLLAELDKASAKISSLGENASPFSLGRFRNV